MEPGAKPLRESIYFAVESTMFHMGCWETGEKCTSERGNLNSAGGMGPVGPMCPMVRMKCPDYNTGLPGYRLELAEEEVGGIFAFVAVEVEVEGGGESGSG